MSARKSGRRVSIEYALIRDKNDQDIHVDLGAKRAVQLLADHVCAEVLIVIVTDNRVLNGDAAAGIVGVVAGSIQHLLHRPAPHYPF